MPRPKSEIPDAKVIEATEAQLFNFRANVADHQKFTDANTDIAVLGERTHARGEKWCITQFDGRKLANLLARKKVTQEWIVEQYLEIYHAEGTQASTKLTILGKLRTMHLVLATIYPDVQRYLRSAQGVEAPSSNTPAPGKDPVASIIKMAGSN